MNASETTIRDAYLAGIAKTCLDIDTLATRNADSLDFHEVAVWSLKDALEAAYAAGAQSKKASRR